MKQFLMTLMLLAFGTAAVYAQNAKMQFKGAETHDFGEITEGKVATHKFVFTNIGKEPLIIQDVSASCGCTTPIWPKQPILPGKTGEIEVQYNSQGKPGPFFKDVYIRSNAQLPDGEKRYTLHIKGNVTPPKG